MNFTSAEVVKKEKYTLKNLLPEMGIDHVHEEIMTGLSCKKKYISSKYFYDKIGSELFEAITKLEEYYPTRTEKSILRQIAPELMNRNSSLEIIELGSGDCSKISILFDAVEKDTLEHLTYVPVDVSESAIEQSANDLAKRHPLLSINGYVLDFMQQLNEIPRSGKPRLICFFGSTIGNFSTKDAQNIIKKLSEEIVPGDSLLVGFDLEKPDEILHAAYNDSKGITLKFNKNILNSINSIMQSDFCESDFDHHAVYNPEKSRVEMHLIANKKCEINSPYLKHALPIEKGEKIHTENSNKFTLSAIEELTNNTNLSIDKTYTDPKNWFALVQFSKKQ